MNWQIGLHRVSAAWWSFCGLIGLFFAVFVPRGSDYVWAAVIMAAFIVVLRLLHGATCWVINGFFPARDKPYSDILMRRD